MRETGVSHDVAAPGRGEAQELAERAARRDGEAWAEIFERHYRSVFSLVRYRLNNGTEAEDIASQVFEVAYSRADRFDYRGVPIEAWLMGIARNLCRDHIKKAVRRGPASELDESTGPRQEDTAAAVDLHEDLSAAMAALTDDQQEVLGLRFMLDLSVEETARQMNRSEDAVKNLQRRALGAMQRALVAAGYPGATP